MNIEQSDWLRLLSTIIVAAITLAGVVFANRTQRGSREHKMVDQFQEQMKAMSARVEALEARDKVYIPHILRLMLHIDQGKGPPAPPIPKVIRDFLEDVS